MALSDIVYLFLLTNQGSVVFSCDDVLINCFGGQFGYTDADYIPIGLHLAVMEGNASVEGETFCRTYQQLETCVRKYIFSCRANDLIWKKWAATELLHTSICSYNNKQKLVLYDNCTWEDDVNNEILQCSSYLSWNRSSFMTVGKAELLSKLYPLIESYIKCALDVVVRHCGVEQAKAAKPQIIHKRQDMASLFSCTIGDINFEGSQTTKEVDCMQSQSCEALLNPFCSSLPYNQATFPNSLGHQSLEAARRALEGDISAIDQERCGSFLSCFLCSLYFPVCSDLSTPVRPCRQFCESTRQSCGTSWNVIIACDELPVGGFCFDSAQCDGRVSQTSPTDQPEVTSTTLLDHEPVVAVSIALVVVMVVVVVIVAVVIRRRNMDTPNAIYGRGELPMETIPSTISSEISSLSDRYWSIPADHVPETNVGHEAVELRNDV
ncbi:hypothetical protein LSH36_837g00017 [Paralvinella palmiformis]|uniref:FZ domain-containing protein n=1 Tax=Paralvinella palmiformis TaxID=53620 RepID=A0AAD9J0Q6_9ANNE|nr:hypothetical protein LSH36_837g00017 [Paralvinella palmiformis]